MIDWVIWTNHPISNEAEKAFQELAETDDFIMY